MSIISELLNLRESSFVDAQSSQTIVKQQSVLLGSLEKVFGKDADHVAELMQAKLSDQIYEFKPTGANGQAAKKAFLSQALSNRQADDVQIIKLIGRRKLIIWKNRVLTTKQEFDNLVEMKIMPEGLSADDERDVQNVGRFARDQALANGQSRDKAAEISKKAMATRRKNLTK